MRFDVRTEAFAEDADIPGHNTVPFGMLLPMFEKILVP
jgi:hypothetical protein